MTFIIFSDGGSRGNPGNAAFGFVIKTQNPIFNFQFSIFNEIPNIKIQIINNCVYGSGFLGVTTNNQAEYHGILEALKFLKFQILNSKSQINSNVQNTNDQKINVECFLDSQLIVEQMNGNYKIKNEGLKPLYLEIREIILNIGGKITFQHIPREQNKEADLLVNEAIDKATL